MSSPSIFADRAVCIGCSVCVTQCRYGAVEMQGDRPVFDLECCVLCGACREACPVDAITQADGELMVDR